MRNIPGYVSEMFLFLLLFLFASRSMASVGITYHGRILKADKTPLEAEVVDFIIRIKSPGNESCLMYEEKISLDMSGSGGVFSLVIGRGQRSQPSLDGGLPLDKIFANRGVFDWSVSAPSACLIGTSYAPNMADGRILQVSFNDGSGWQQLSPQPVNYVPLAIESMQVGGYKKEQLLRVDKDTSTENTELSSAHFSELLKLINGTSTLYSKTDSAVFSGSTNFTGAVGFSQPPTSNTAPSSNNELTNKVYTDSHLAGRDLDITGLSNGQVLTWDQAAAKWVVQTPSNIPGGNAGGDLTGTYPSPSVNSVGGVSASNVASGANLANAATNSNVTNSIVKRDASGNFTAGTITANLNGHATSATTATNFSGSLTGDVTGTQSGTTVGALQGRSVSSAAPSNGSMLSWNNTFSRWEPTTPPVCALNQTLRFNITSGLLECADMQGLTDSALAAGAGISRNKIAAGSPNHVLINDGSGMLSSEAQLAISRGGTGLNSAPANGQLLIGNGTGYALSNIQAGTGINVVNGAGSITISTTGASPTGAAGGDLSGTYPSPLVATVGGVTAANVASGANLANAATNLNTASSLVRRDGSGNFSAGTITADLIGNVTGNVSGSAASFTGSLNGDVTGSQGATVVGKIQGRTVASTAPNSNEMLIWNGAQWQPATAASVGAYVNGGNSFGAAATIGTNDGNSLAFETNGTSRLSIASTGEITAASQFRLAQAFNAGGATSFDWNNGNTQYTTASCGAFTFANMKDGGSYTLIVLGTTSGTCSFSQTTPDSLSSPTNFKFSPANGATVNGSMTVYTMLRAGNYVFVSWITGYQ